MKDIKLTYMIFILVLCLASCGNKDSRLDTKGRSIESGKEVSQDTVNSKTERVLSEESSISDERKSEPKIDYDLTVMGSDMVYATIYQFMVNPDEYEGKKIRIQGTYASTYDKNTKKYYHYCVVQDAAACCVQGMEFIWDNGSHIYPDEYPNEKTKIIVTGFFETYREKGDSYLYCRLKDAMMEVMK